MDKIADSGFQYGMVEFKSSFCAQRKKGSYKLLPSKTLDLQVLLFLMNLMAASLMKGST